MRVTTGIFKGRRLEEPKGIRPTQEKVRKAIFDILGDIEGLSLLELFAGSGAVGIEAASRGAKEVVLVENNPACVEVITRNIAGINAQNCVFYHQEANRAIEILCKKHKCFDIIFLDPPYHKDEVKKALQTLEAYDILAPNGLVIAQHFKRESLPDNPGVLTLFKQYTYGSNILSLFKKEENVPGSDISGNV